MDKFNRFKEFKKMQDIYADMGKAVQDSMDLVTFSYNFHNDRMNLYTANGQKEKALYHRLARDFWRPFEVQKFLAKAVAQGSV